MIKPDSSPDGNCKKQSSNNRGWLQQPWLRRSLLFLLSVVLVLVYWQAPIVPLGKVTSQELRGIWMTNLGAALMYYTTRLDDTVADLARHRLNTLYPAVWNRGHTLHPSSVTQRVGGHRRNPLTTLPLLPYQDVLSGLVDQAHRQHLRLIPWFEYGLMIPPNSAIARRHPDWLTTTQSGAKTLHAIHADHFFAKPGRKPQALPAEANQAWLNPCHPEVQKFLVNLMQEVAQRYSIDGIQLDDHFGLPIAFGYDAYTRKLYQAEHAGQLPPSKATDPEWMAWRAKHLTQLMSQITRAVKAARPEAIVSLSPNAPDFAYRKYLQDWTRWVKLGLVDEVIVQIYRPDLTSLNRELANNSLTGLQSSVRISVGLYTGPFLAAKPIQQIQQQVEAVRAAKYKGVSFFCWETTLWLFKHDSSAQVSRGLRKLFPALSKTPA
jgi:uncharacterized lipoprotein YddW (UPF0748 family)